MKVSDESSLNNRTQKPVHLTAVGFGGAPLGNLYSKVEEESAQAALQAAYDCGIRYFDTAPQYGLGISETRMGLGIANFGRENIVLSTKVGRILEDCTPEEVTPEAFVHVPQKKIRFDYSYDGIMKSYDHSKTRLGVDNADLLLVHDVDVFSHGSQEISDSKVRELFDQGGYKALTELRSAGEITGIGAGVNEWQVCEKLLGLGDFDGFLLAGRYTLLEQGALRTFLPLCEKRDVGIILGGPFNSGILATGAVPGAKYNYADAPKEIMDRVRNIERVCAAHGVGLKEAALQFVLAHPAVKSVIPGAVSPEQVKDNVTAFEADIPNSLWSDLKTENLIWSIAPTPAN